MHSTKTWYPHCRYIIRMPGLSHYVHEAHGTGPNPSTDIACRGYASQDPTGQGNARPPNEHAIHRLEVSVAMEWLVHPLMSFDAFRNTSSQRHLYAIPLMDVSQLNPLTLACCATAASSVALEHRVHRLWRYLVRT
jgi:hypothetical protein